MDKEFCQNAVAYHRVEIDKHRSTIEEYYKTIADLYSLHLYQIGLKVGDKFKINLKGWENDVLTLKGFRMNYQGVFEISAVPFADQYDVVEPYFTNDDVFNITKI